MLLSVDLVVSIVTGFGVGVGSVPAGDISAGGGVVAGGGVAAGGGAVGGVVVVFLCFFFFLCSVGDGTGSVLVVDLFSNAGSLVESGPAGVRVVGSSDLWWVFS